MNDELTSKNIKQMELRLSKSLARKISNKLEGEERNVSVVFRFDFVKEGQEPDVDSVKTEIRALGGTVRMELNLVPAVSADMSAKSVLHILQSNPYLFAELDVSGDLE